MSPRKPGVRAGGGELPGGVVYWCGTGLLSRYCRSSQMGRCFSFPTGATFVNEPAWKAANRAHWDEKVSLHLGPRGYDLTRLRAGRGRFSAIEEVELWPIDGSRILHLQFHFGSDSLKFAQRGAKVVGLDFSPPAIDARYRRRASACR
jgi:hypothetical protein